MPDNKGELFEIWHLMKDRFLPNTIKYHSNTIKFLSILSTDNTENEGSVSKFNT